MNVSDFGFTVHKGQYRVTVARDPHHDGYRAHLISVGLGTIMEPHGKTPSAALTQLVKELAESGDSYDRSLAREIARYAWFPLKVP